MASYNGSQFIAEQLSSVLGQLGERDELIIVDDCSTDDTLAIIKSFADRRMKVLQNQQNLGHVKTFSKALAVASSEFIFLCDQDDVWVEDRLAVFERYFRLHPDVQLITSKFHCIDDNGRAIENVLPTVSHVDSKNYRKNIMSIFRGNIGYFGCAMAFRRELVQKLLPIPSYVEAHDLWVAMLANKLHSNLHIDEKTLYHRIHDRNTSNLKRSLLIKLRARYAFIKQYNELRQRLK